MNQSTTIVTAFFDIGRGNWNSSHGHLDHLERTTDTYFNYFSQLAKLDNNIVVFTSSDFKERILKIRKGKPTQVIVLDINKKFKHIIKKISVIQHSHSFKERINSEQLANPEYWCPEYVLLTNLKTYFVNKAVQLGLVRNELISWIDFGYVRNNKTRYGIKKWNYPFDREKMHFFSIRDGLDLTNHNLIMKYLIENHTYIIGGVIVGTKEQWARLYKLTLNVQHDLLSSGIIDDDQGVFLVCANKKPDLVKIHFLGYMKWFSMFKLFNKNSKINYFERLAIQLRLMK
ncbi:protein YibB [Providencia alcalifaciens]|uniref:protein YibB n=1 Tax=Providencia alcalifaciens TaxID=126385 RepID=UPI00045311DD|nr:protein YibB [Providencia alcalifaciens]ETT08246.1 protein YibB [Providencia alcalifaciens F90-2004]EUC95071.1 protein YibB [Providencia alcalifaciens PAL-2]EUD07069.1 protein YibB [Providencia alcalifaciens R90-1475]MBF0692629.1 protein YibB [Providencia alcalifaciens]MTB33256.1 protein YibB [Providencia alcalifaciens]